MLRKAFLLMLGMTTALSAQDSELKIGAYYTLVLPPDCQHWWVMPKAEDAVYSAPHVVIQQRVEGGVRARACDLDTADVVHGAGFVQYTHPMLAKLLDLGVVVAMISTSGRVGWVSRELLKPRAIYDRTEWATPADRAAVARQREERAREQAYIASLPRLIGTGSQVLVATSRDCARDHAKLVELGRTGGTGVEFRKKMAEFMSVGCGLLLPSGTPIIVSGRDPQFVEFSVYNGPRKGTRGVALSRDVTQMAARGER